MSYSTALAKLTDYVVPMFQYLGGNGGLEINAETITDFCADIEKEWNSLDFSFNATSSEVVNYINLRNNTDPEDRISIMSDHDYANSEVYIFFNYCIQVCSLDSYGRCETIDGSRAALERGSHALQTGILIPHLQKLPPWTVYAEEFGGQEQFVAWLMNRPLGTSYTNQELPSSEERAQIAQQWKEVVRVAFV
jgi:hypothetical protein